MGLVEIQNKFIDEIKYVDDTAQIVLKGHLVAEDLMNKAIESFVLHGEYIDNVKLQFHQKIEFCKAISVSESKNNMWNMLKHINVVRNALSHSLDAERRSKAIQSLRTIYDQEFPSNSRNIKGISEDAALCMAAISGVLGYLHAFLEEVQRFEEIVKGLDVIMNTGKLSNNN